MAEKMDINIKKSLEEKEQKRKEEEEQRKARKERIAAIMRRTRETNNEENNAQPRYCKLQFVSYSRIKMILLIQW